jgi:hypothetical protein
MEIFLFCRTLHYHKNIFKWYSQFLSEIYFEFLKKEILLQSDYYLTCKLYKLLIYFAVQ